MAPLVCTNNTQGHYDYGIPIVANKSTDYRTIYKSYHQLIPSKGQDFDCRQKVRILPQYKINDWNMKDTNYTTNYNANYYAKLSGSDPTDVAPNPLPYENTHYFRTEQERYFKSPPPPIGFKLSEMKENYQGYPKLPEYKEVFPPEPYAKCAVMGLGRDEQPPIRPQNKGFYKWLDPYLTHNRATHINFTQEDRSGIGEKDIITFYVGKGYNPVNAPPTEPILSTRKEPVYDKVQFKQRIPLNIVRKKPPSMPYAGKTSTYRQEFIKQTFSDMFPYLFQNGEEFADSLPEASPWQNLCPPAMYCTEYCHIGTGWPVRCSVDFGDPEKVFIHDRCFSKFCDWTK